MSGTAFRATGNPPLPSYANFDAAPLKEALRKAVPPLLFGLRLWASVCLALYIAFWLELDNAYWAGTSAAIVCQPQLGASLRKGWFRMIGTLVGAIMIVVLTACFPQDRGLFLGGLALWGAVCAFVATLLRNFASYAAALAGYTVAIIGGDLLGATGGVNADSAFLFAVTRASEICIGIVSAGVVLAGTDLGGARRRLAALFAGLSSGIMSRFASDLVMAGPDLADATPVRREFIRKVIALEPAVDQAFGESSQLRYHSPMLQKAVDGLFAALAGWRAVANHLARITPDRARAEAGLVLDRIPPELREPPKAMDPMRWTSNPARLHRTCEAAARRLIDFQAGMPSLRLLADQTAKALTGIADALNGLALLVSDPAQSLPRGGSVRLHVPDWLPALVSAGRAFVTIGAVAFFWVVTAWPNGASALVFAAIDVILLTTRGDQAYPAAAAFAIGCFITAVCAAIIEFALLPALPGDTFIAFAIGIGVFLVPAGALIAQPWLAVLFTAMAANFLPILAPANQMSYDTAQFYNQASAIVLGGVVGAASFRLLPPLSPAFRTRRLLALSLRDLRRLAVGHWQGNWEGLIHARLAAMPEQATPLQRAQLLAALSVGMEIMRLRRVAHWLGLSGELGNALAAVARGDSATAIADLVRLDGALAEHAVTEPQALHGRGSILAVTEVLSQHAAYFDAGPAG